MSLPLLRREDHQNLGERRDPQSPHCEASRSERPGKRPRSFCHAGHG
ncbi:hypothetical protein EYF80_063351 [Liparis tanakae]|uniref:Uncharacterized protein n=1 Tax=Liparis tanakae TaxID=230148 RepID=A0A4Z2EE07_9TELE|nr:hypothetical protein EYF80_063351 [Liparis tanakae]